MNHGWKIGEENQMGHTLNQESYDMSKLGPMAEIAILRDMRKEVRKGRVIEWLGKREGKIPIFAIPKKINPITGKIEKWRIIRDGKHAQNGTKSVNDLTPDYKATMKLVTAWGIQSYIVIMFLLWGRNCYLGKTDLAEAFRQFYFAEGETKKILYEIADMILGDLMVIWGTRSGGRVCQDWTEMMARVMNILQNGEHQLHEINEVIEKENYRLYQNRYERTTEDVPNFESKGSVQNIWKWKKSEIKKWIEEEKMTEIGDIIRDLEDGKDLIFSHRDLACFRWNEEQMERLEKCGFFGKLQNLKLKSKCCIMSITRAYIDDFITILAPNRRRAQKAFEESCKFINESGMREEGTKRFGVEKDMTFLGVHYDVQRTEMTLTKKKKEAVKKLLERGLNHGNISLQGYESLVGKLSDLAILVWPGKAFIRRMRERVLKMVEKHGRQHTIVIIDEWEKRDWIWWWNFLNECKPVNVLRRLRPRKPNHLLAVDGATNGSEDGPRGWRPGVGCWYKGQWIAMEVPEGMTKGFKSRNKGSWIRCQIQHFEMMAVVVAFANMDLEKGSEYVLQTDNRHVESALKTKNSGDEVLMNGVRWITQWVRRNDITFYIEYIHTKANVMADHCSRYKMKEIREEGGRRCRQRGWTLRRKIDNILFPNLIRGDL